jgi:MFS family permease
VRSAACVAVLGTTQTLGYASTYYLPAILAAPIAADLRLPGWSVYACLSAALVIAGVLSPWAGRRVDAGGGRLPLMLSSVLFAAGLAALSAAQGPWMLAAAWLLIGAGMGSGLYDVAFATAVGLYGRAARGVITGITLVAGFASTVGWPAMAVAETQLGWRGTCLGWAALHLCVGLPLHRLLPAASGRRAAPAEASAAPQRGLLVLLAGAFALYALVGNGVAASLPDLLHIAGASPNAAIAAAALLGPAQVAARLLEFGLLRRVHPMWSARAALLLHPVAAAALLLLGPAAAPAFAILHGAGNGLLTISKGTLPLALFGPAGYGGRQGLIAVPVNAAAAGAPLLLSLLASGVGRAAFLVSAAISVAACGLLFLVNAVPGLSRQAGRH